MTVFSSSVTFPPIHSRSVSVQITWNEVLTLDVLDQFLEVIHANSLVMLRNAK